MHLFYFKKKSGMLYVASHILLSKEYIGRKVVRYQRKKNMIKIK